MPKVTLTMSEDQLLLVLNRDLKIPGRVESVVSHQYLEIMEGYDLGSETVYVVLIDLEPVHDYGTAFTFAIFARAMFGPENDISEVEDPEDYAVLENMLAAASQFDMYSFDWMD